jgi:class 3 adenylate cyclase
VETCPSCGRELPGEFPFCPFCGASVSAGTRADAETAERKVVTCLFCDLVGFTAQAERLDPEDVRAMLRPYHARVRAELERALDFYRSVGATAYLEHGEALLATTG